MKSAVAFLAIFSVLLLLCSSTSVDGRKHPDEYWTKGRNLRMLVPMRKAMEGKPSEQKSIKGILSIGEFKYPTVDTDKAEAEEDEPLGTSSEPGGDSKEEEHLDTSSVPFGSGGGDPKEKKPFFFRYYGPKVPVN